MAVKAKNRITLGRRDVTARLLAGRGDALLVTGLGGTCWDAAAAGDDPRNFYLWGAMGGAAMVGLGLALAHPRRRVLVLTGDGEMLMGLGALATISVQKPENLAIVVLDNEHYGETGMQATHTRFGVDLAGIARAAGFRVSRGVYSPAQFERAISGVYRASGPVFVCVKVKAQRLPMVLPERDGPLLKERFRQALLGAQ